MARKKKTVRSEGPGENYFGPYERWNFGPGEPFAFPAIRKWKKYLTIVSEVPKEHGTQRKVRARVATDDTLVWWLPTVWKETFPLPRLTFLPFVIKNVKDGTIDLGDLA